LGAGEQGRISASVIACVQSAAGYHGFELDPTQLDTSAKEQVKTSALLAHWVSKSGLWARATKMSWQQVMRLQISGPIVFLLHNADALCLTAVNAKANTATFSFIGEDNIAQEVVLDELRLSRFWDGEVVLIRPKGELEEAEKPFSLSWIRNLVLRERGILGQMALASLTLSFITVFPPLLVMATVNRVLEYHSTSSLVLISLLLTLIIVYEMILTHMRRLMMSTVGARIDAKLSIYVYEKLLQLPLDFFEKNPAGEILFKIGKVYKIRNFLTGKLLTTLLDFVTLIIVFPILFYINAALAWIILACAVLITAIIAAFLPSVRASFARLTAAENQKYAVLGETIAGIKTIKSMAMEPQRSRLWEERIADAGLKQLSFDKLSSWPATLTSPIDRLMTLGTLMLGAYWATYDASSIQAGTLFGFMMLSYRVSQPLVGFAKLIEDVEEVGAAVGEVASVVNREREVAVGKTGLRPQMQGELRFQGVTFTYPGTSTPALKQLSFEIPPGTLLGIVGKSGSGKSTIARLLQGINREYTGFLKLDGNDLKDIDLHYLRSSLGVVLQENFLFRGTIRENIIAGRKGLTFSDAVHAARLAGADEFIERLPNGFETYIEEGSPNLSGGQRQRLAIARALMNDPKLLILDEATSALDPESEAIVNANLMRISKGRTTVVVSHRLSSLIGSDKILVLDQGELQDIGTHTELLSRCAVYRRLWQQQNKTPEARQAERGLSIVPLLREME
jgi:ATP-binding cassette, subfamily B, bacterial HlyB/CyaB